MSIPFAIKAENLSKFYRLGTEPRLNRTLSETIAGSLRRINFFSPRGRNAEVAGKGDFWALSEVSFQIKPGEVVGIIGRNGAGKSTLLKILSRITAPSRGRAEIFGRVSSLLEVGTGFHPELTGRENIYLNGSILGMSRREIALKFDEIVNFSELEGFIDTPVKRYSSGMYVRLAFAVAAHLEPEILLVDEVLAVGDAAFQKKCLGKMSDAAKCGRTILFVSHNMAALLNFCQRGILLAKGRVIADDKIEPVIHHYLKGLRTTVASDLSKYEDRQGRGRVRFTQIRFEDGQGNATEQAVAGHPLVIALDYRSLDNRPLSNCRASIAFHDALGQVLFNCSSELTISDPITLPPAGTIRCLIPRFPLSQSQYQLTLFLEVNREIEDWILSAIELGAVDGDFYGTGRLYPDGWRGKGVLVPHRWIIGDR